MRIRRRKKAGFVELVVASDLAFLLIVYFIVIAGFNINTGFIVNLPARNSVRQVLPEELLRFELDAEGRLLHRGRDIDLAEAGELIGGAREGNADIAVLLTVNPLTGWQEVVSFVELAQNMRIQAFSFVIDKEAGQ